MQAGSFRRRVDIEYQVQTKDSTGSVVPTWTVVFRSVPCSITAWRGRESFLANQVQSDVTWKVLFRFLPDLDASMRCVEYLSPDRKKRVIYNIESVMPDNDGMNVELLCRTRLTEGFRSDGG